MELLQLIIDGEKKSTKWFQKMKIGNQTWKQFWSNKLKWKRLGNEVKCKKKKPEKKLAKTIKFVYHDHKLKKKNTTSRQINIKNFGIKNLCRSKDRWEKKTFNGEFLREKIL